MQAYHQQIANLNLPNGTSGLLIASPPQYANMHQQQHLQHQHQQSSYQELVKAYLPQLSTMSNTGLASLSTSPASSSPSLSLSSTSSSSMASFAARLMSLNAHELKCLNSDNELMRHIHETQVLIDNRLSDIHSKSGADQSRLSKQQQLHHQHQPQHSSQNQLNLTLVQQHQEQQLHLHQRHQHQQQLLMSSDNYYQNYYAQQLALSQMAQLQQHQNHHQHQQQLLMMDSGYNTNNKSANYPNLSSVEPRTELGQQQLNNLTTQSATSSISEERTVERANSNQQQMSIPALDLRTTPTRPVSETPSPKSVRSRSGSIESSRNSRQQQHPKKAKLTEYRKLQQSNDPNSGLDGQATCSTSDQQQHSNNVTQYQDISTNKTSTTLVSNENFHNQTDSKGLQQLSLPNEMMHQEGSEHHRNSITLNSNIANTRSSRLQANQNGKLVVVCGGNAPVVPVAKKHKGEFDEPSPSEVAEREHQLSRPEHYHRRALELGTCACILGSEFTTKTPREALEQLDQWRSLDIEQRIKWKWDLNDLPKDIPLSDIKKFEDLRRDFSNGRADFGGASKRKPLGIRGTRQFLLMLYCLWGHPGRDDPMQQNGYCPHCFAKIRTENEQSTLVRVVNHFNMKHRRGANPRLSPETRASTTPQDHLICETLKSVVETAIASSEGDQVSECKQKQSPTIN